MSCLKSIANIKLYKPRISQIVAKYHHLAKLGMDIVMWWLPGNVGIKGHEMVDSAAKAALSCTIQQNTPLRP